MTALNELLDNIKKNPKFIKIVDPNQDFDFYKFYTIYWKEDDIVKSTSVCIYIDNRGLPNESAYFKDNIPELSTIKIQTQQEKLTSDVNTKITEVMATDTTIENITIRTSNQDIIECTAYKYNSSTDSVSKINIVFYYDKNNKLIWRKIT